MIVKQGVRKLEVLHINDLCTASGESLSGKVCRDFEFCRIADAYFQRDVLDLPSRYDDMNHKITILQIHNSPKSIEDNRKWS